MISTIYHYIASINFITVLQFLGCVTFSISGIRLASARKVDWFGALVLGYITAIGGGTLRDLLLGKTPFWMLTTLYIWSTLIALFTVIFFRKHLVRLKNTIFWFDCIGLSLIVVVGYEKALSLGNPYWICIFMGTVSAIFGGMTRDMLINQVPLAFYKELYATSCLLGGVVFSLLHYVHVHKNICAVVSCVFMVTLRVLAAHYHWKIPMIKGDEHYRLKNITKYKYKYKNRK